MKKLNLLVLVLAFGCSKSEKGGGETKGTDTPTPTAKATTGDSKTASKEPPSTPDIDAKVAVPEIAAPTGMFACKNKGKPAPAAASDKSDKWSLPFALTSCPSIPSVYGTATFGMDTATAQKAVKGSKPIDGTIGFLYLGKHPFRQQFSFRFDDKTGLLNMFAFSVDTKRFDELKAAWGEPVAYQHMGDPALAWFDPEAKIKVIARADKLSREPEVDGYNINMVSYSPLSELLGEGLVGKPVIGKTAEELATMFPNAIDAKTEAQAKEQLDKLGLDEKTKANVNALGAAGASVNLELLETETGSFHTLVQPDWEGSKVTAYSFSLSHGKNKALEAEILGTVGAVLGKPVGASKTLDDTTIQFAGKNNTTVEVQPSILGDAWTIRVVAKK